MKTIILILISSLFVGCATTHKEIVDLHKVKRSQEELRFDTNQCVKDSYNTYASARFMRFESCMKNLDYDFIQVEDKEE